MTDETRPEDGPLPEAFETLEPGGPALQRMEGVVLAAHALSQRPLAAEWLELLRARPITGTLLLAAAAVVLLAATPLGAILALAGRFT